MVKGFKKAFKPFKRFFKRTARIYKRKKKATGFKLRNSILSASLVKPVEVAFPIYALVTGPVLTIGGYPFAYSFDPATAYTNQRLPAGALNNVIYTQLGVSREFVNLSKVYGLCRVKSVVLRYFRSVMEGQTSITNSGPISLGLSCVTNGGATDYDTMIRNWTQDGNMIFNPMMVYKKSRLYKYPLRSIGINNWLAPTNLVASTTLYLQLGMPPQDITTGGGTPCLNILASNTATGAELVGSVVVRFYVEWANPQTST